MRSDLFPLPASIFPRLADVISDTAKEIGRFARKNFAASGKPALEFREHIL